MAKTPPLFALRSRFDQALTLVEAAPAGVVGAVFSAFVAGTAVYILLSIIGLGRFLSVEGVLGLFFVLGFALSPAAYYEIKKFAYKNTFYAFYDDWLEYQEFRFFVTRRRGRVRLRDIRDVYERASPLQARRTLTSLYLAVPGMNPAAERQGGFSGLKILDVPENSGARDKIVELIEASAARAQAQAQTPAPAAPPPPPPAETAPGA
jgi:hypothetical protein